MKALAKILLHRLDVTDLDSFAVFSETVRQQRNKYLFIEQKMEKVGRICGTEGIHVLLNNAGVAPKSTRINMVRF